MARASAFWILALGLWAARASASEQAQFLPVGIVFPEFTHALRTNASALPFQQGRALQFEVSPGGFESGYAGTFTYSRSLWGAGLGYEALQGTGSGLTHELLAGAGVRISSVTLGLSLSSPFLTTPFSPSYDASFEIGDGSKLRFAGILYNASGSADTMAFGLGHRGSSWYAIEGGAQLPFFTRMFSPGTGNSYLAYVAGAVFAGNFAFAANAGFNLGGAYSPGQSLSALWAPGRRLRLTALLEINGMNYGISNVGLFTGTGALTLGLALEL